MESGGGIGAEGVENGIYGRVPNVSDSRARTVGLMM